MKYLFQHIFASTALALNLLKGFPERFVPNSAKSSLGSPCEENRNMGLNKFRASAKNFISQVNVIKYILCLLLLISSTASGKSHPKPIEFNATDESDGTKKISITFNIAEKDFIYKDFITCSIQEPEVKLSPWKTNTQSISHYDPSFKETKQVFNETFSLTMSASIHQWIADPIHLYCSYYRKADKKINHALFTFTFTQPLNTNIQIQDVTIENTAEPSYITTHAHRIPISLFDQYWNIFMIAIQNLITFFITHHKKCFSVLLFLIILFSAFFYMHQEWLRKYKKWHEAVEMIIASLIVIGITYSLAYCYMVNTISIRTGITITSVLFSGIIGLFYIKKSTQLQSGFLRTFCTFIGMLSIIIALFLAFKALQYFDDTFVLF